jgi:hypothetical protein
VAVTAGYLSAATADHIVTRTTGDIFMAYWTPANKLAVLATIAISAAAVAIAVAPRTPASAQVRLYTTPT